jgi:serine/threonine protein kinase
VLKLAAGLAEGLSAIHAAGVVHRDLKPSNVLLARDGPRLIDFGISRASGASALSHPGLLVGSPGFMSPEQPKARRPVRLVMYSAWVRSWPSPPRAKGRSALGRPWRWSTA